MPLSLPNLDNRRYDDLVREALAMIPAVAPEWTNHNASDPGITLVEMLAYLTEILIYRVNRIGDRQLAVFVLLLTGREALPDKPLEEQIQHAVLEIRRTTRAVTAQDYETLALQIGHHPGAGTERIARAYCLTGYNLTIRGENRKRPGHMSVIVVPAREGNERHPKPSAETLTRMHKELEEYRLITTRLHVVGPKYLPVRISGTVDLLPNAHERQAQVNVHTALERFLQAVPDVPGAEGGWPFGKDIYVSELYDLIERQPGVDYVRDLELDTTDESRLMRNSQGKVIGIDLRENELPMAEIKDLRTRYPMSGHRDSREGDAR